MQITFVDDPVCVFPRPTVGQSRCWWTVEDEQAERDAAAAGDKVCSACGVSLPATAEYFVRDASTKTGLSSICKPCNRARLRRWKSTNYSRYRDTISKCHNERYTGIANSYEVIGDTVHMRVLDRDGQEHICLFDAEDLELVKAANAEWFRDATGYVRKRNFMSSGPQALHILILGKRTSRHEQCDHINRDRLDNRRENIRLVPAWVNTLNRSTRRSKSGYRGVSWSARDKGWRVHIRVNGRSFGRLHKDYFAACAEARKIYLSARIPREYIQPIPTTEPEAA